MVGMHHYAWPAHTARVWQHSMGICISHAQVMLWMPGQGSS